MKIKDRWEQDEKLSIFRKVEKEKDTKKQQESKNKENQKEQKCKN